MRDLQDAGYEAYIVGGSVRDLLLGKHPKDFDVATDATPEQVQRVFPRCRLIGRRFRLAHVRHNGALIEVATFRGSHHSEGDGAAHQGRIIRDNVWGTLREDALRRDFTINALFLDPVGGDISDFTGGYDDLGNRRLSLVGDPHTRYREDPVRLLRAARFVAKLGVEPDEATAKPIAELAHLLKDVPKARLFEEVCKLFLTGHGLRSLETLQRFQLSATMFPVIERVGRSGKIVIDDLLPLALKSTDERVAKNLPVTPAFLFACLLWGPMWALASKAMEKNSNMYDAILKASDRVFSKQIEQTGVPRRFSAVTRQIWLMQARFLRTGGKRAQRLIRDRNFRAAYDFLVLRAELDESLADNVKFWREAQAGFDFHGVQRGSHGASHGRRRRPRRRRPVGQNQR